MDEFGLDPVIKLILLAKSFPTVYHGPRLDNQIKNYGRLMLGQRTTCFKAYTQNPNPIPITLRLKPLLHTRTHTQDLKVDNWVALTGLFGLLCLQLTERKRKQNLETTFQNFKRQRNQISIKSEY